MTLRETFAQRVKEWRGKRGLTMKSMGGRLSPPVTAPYIAAVESGKDNPTLDQVERIAGALNVDPRKLLR
jgi:transcriptional regulator with XRE-family HTH domain